MKVSLKQVWEGQGSLQKLLDADYLVSKISIRIARLAKVLFAELNLIEKQRVALVEKFGTKDKDGKLSIPPDTDAFKAFAEEFGEMLDQDVELDIQSVELPEGCNIPPRVFVALDSFITVKGDKTPAPVKPRLVEKEEDNG